MEQNIVLKIRSRLGEGIWWDDRRKCLFWVEGPMPAFLL